MPARLPSLARRLDGLAVGSGVAATGIALFQLVWPTTRGVADNGDFARLLCHLQLLPDLPPGEPPFFRQVHPTWHHTYKASQGVVCDYHSPAQRVLEVAEHLSWHLPGHHGLDLRVVATLYSVGLGVAIGLLVWGLPRHRWVRRVGALLAIALLTDFDFVAHFTGALSEPLGYVALIALAGLLLRWWSAERHRGTLLASLAATGAVLVATKPQYAAVAAPIVVVIMLGSAFAAFGFEPPHRMRQLAPGLAAAATVLVVSVWTVQRAPASFDPINRYDAFFDGLLPHADNPAATLRDFGLPARFVAFSGKPWWSPASGRADPTLPQYLSKITIPRMARYWTLHPSEAFDAAARATRAGASAHLDYLGKTASAHDFQPNWCAWCPASWAGRQLRPAAPVLLPLAWIASLAVAAWTLRRHRRGDAAALAVTLAVLAGIAGSQLVVSILGEGDYEQTKHLFLMTASDVLLVVLGGAALAGAIATRAAKT